MQASPSIAELNMFFQARILGDDFMLSLINFTMFDASQDFRGNCIPSNFMNYIEFSRFSCLIKFDFQINELYFVNRVKQFKKFLKKLSTVIISLLRTIKSSLLI